MNQYYDMDNPDRTRLFTTARNRKFVVSTEQLNRELQKEFNSDEKEFLTSGTEIFMEGDPVVFLRNNYETGYFNGDEGTVIGIEKSGSRMKLLVQTDTLLEISGNDLRDVSLAYATTVHKSQGSECDVAIILLPEKPVSLLRKDLLYVAATRAKKKNIFVVQDYGMCKRHAYNAMEEACLNIRAPERKSGLLNKIRKLMM